MLIYYSIFGFLFLVMILNELGNADKDKCKRNVCIIMFLVITTMFALRHPSMGNDLRYLSDNGYLGSFDYISGLSWRRVLTEEVLNYERGYIIFNKLVGMISRDRQFFLAVCAIIPMIPVAWVIYKKSVSPAISFIIFMGMPSFFVFYSALRQVLAIGLCIFAIKFIIDKKIVRFILLVLLASTFHGSSILFLAAYPAYHLKIKGAYRKWTVLAIFVVYVFRRPLFSILSKFLKEDATMADTGGFTLFLVFTLVYVFCILYTDGSDEQSGLMNVFFLACCCQAFGGVYYTAMRVGYYFMFSLALLLPSVLKNMTLKANKNLYTTVVVAAFVIFGLYSIKNSTWACAYPYYFYWEVV